MEQFLIVGLGNPGKEYEKTLHNVGFRTIDFFAQQNEVFLTKTKCKALIYDGHLFNKKVILAKPLTYMNLSGESVRELIQKFKIPMQNILIIFDDFDLPVGEIRYRNNGSAGTHNGVKSVCQELNSTEFARIKIGIKNSEINDLAKYVLSNTDATMEKVLALSFEKASNLIKEFLIKNGKLDNKSLK